MASYNDQPAEKDDIFKILSQSPRRWWTRTRRGACKLESYEATPSYEA